MSKTRPIVYVVQENRNADYSDAERYGEVVFITADEFKPLNASLRNEAIKEQIVRKLAQFEPDDFLVLTGNPTIIGFAFHTVLKTLESKDHMQEVNVLQWDRMTNGYRPFKFTTTIEA